MELSARQLGSTVRGEEWVNLYVGSIMRWGKLDITIDCVLPASISRADGENHVINLLDALLLLGR